MIGDTNGLFGLLAGCYIADNRRNPESIADLNGTEADLNGEFGSIAAPGLEDVSVTHGTPHRMGKVTRAMRGMRCGKVSGEECIDVAPEQLVSRVAEEFFGYPVQEDDPAFGVDFDDGVGRGFEQLTETAQLFPVPVFGGGNGKIDCDENHTSISAIAARCRRELDGDDSAVLCDEVPLSRNWTGTQRSGQAERRGRLLAEHLIA